MSRNDRMHMTNAVKITYKSKLYLGFLYVLLTVFIAINTWTLINGQIISLLPLGVQIGVFISILTKWRHVKIIIRVYGIMLLLAGGLQLLAQLLFMIADAQDKISYDTMLSSLLLTALGLVIFIFCNETITVGDGETQKDQTEPEKERI